MFERFNYRQYCQQFEQQRCSESSGAEKRTSVNGNTTWYKLSSGGWITAAYVKEVSGNTTTNPGNSGNNTIGTNINGAAIVKLKPVNISGHPTNGEWKGPDVLTVPVSPLCLFYK